MSLRRQLRRSLMLMFAVLLMACAQATQPPPTSEPVVQPTEAPAEPIKIGGTLALTGFLAPTAQIHKIAGELFVEQLNARGGLLGRPVEWVVLDDESTPDKAAALYERLITEDEVDLLMGPYGTGTITAAMQVAERYGYVFPHHTASLTYAYTYDCHFPTWYTGLHTDQTTPDLVFDALDSTGTPPRTVGFVINQFPGTKFLAYGQDGNGGAVKVAEDHGYEVVLNVDFPTGTTDFGPIAAQVRDADPDFIYVGAIGNDGPNLLDALRAIGYEPRGHFYQWPAPGPLAAAGEGALSVTLFEPFEPFLSNPGAREMVDLYTRAAEDAGLPYTVPETQAAASWAAWQVLTTAVESVGSLDQRAICDWLKENTVDTVIGPVSFDPTQQNYGPDLQKIKQVQNGDWVVVYPQVFATEGRTLIYNPGP